MTKNDKKSLRNKPDISERLDEYLELMKSKGLEELEISDGSVNVKLVRTRAAKEIGYESPIQPTVDLIPALIEAEEPGAKIEAPIAGVFYGAASPSAPPFVREGDTVSPGQVLCIIEAMKVMNEITAETSGKIKRIAVENGKSVEAGSVLFILEAN